jgi:hypothetical protein
LKSSERSLEDKIQGLTTLAGKLSDITSPKRKFEVSKNDDNGIPLDVALFTKRLCEFFDSCNELHDSYVGDEKDVSIDPFLVLSEESLEEQNLKLLLTTNYTTYKQRIQEFGAQKKAYSSMLKWNTEFKSLLKELIVTIIEEEAKNRDNFVKDKRDSYKTEHANEITLSNGLTNAYSQLRSYFSSLETLENTAPLNLITSLKAGIVELFSISNNAASEFQKLSTDLLHLKTVILTKEYNSCCFSSTQNKTLHNIEHQFKQMQGDLDSSVKDLNNLWKVFMDTLELISKEMQQERFDEIDAKFRSIKFNLNSIEKIEGNARNNMMKEFDKFQEALQNMKRKSVSNKTVLEKHYKDINSLKAALYNVVSEIIHNSIKPLSCLLVEDPSRILETDRDAHILLQNQDWHTDQIVQKTQNTLLDLKRCVESIQSKQKLMFFQNSTYERSFNTLKRNLIKNQNLDQSLNNQQDRSCRLDLMGDQTDVSTELESIVNGIINCFDKLHDEKIELYKRFDDMLKMKDVTILQLNRELEVKTRKPDSRNESDGIRNLLCYLHKLNQYLHSTAQMKFINSADKTEVKLLVETQAFILATMNHNYRMNFSELTKLLLTFFESGIQDYQQQSDTVLRTCETIVKDTIENFEAMCGHNELLEIKECMFKTLQHNIPKLSIWKEPSI